MTGLLRASLFILAVAAGAVAPFAAQAQDASVADLLRKHANAGTLAQGERDLSARPENAQTVAARGMIAFASAVEKLGQNLFRYGLRPPRHPMIPILRLPVPENPKPEPLTYEKLRAVYATFSDDLAAAEKILAGLPDGPVKLPLDLHAVRLDLNGDGAATQEESIGAILIALTRGRPAPGQQSAQPESWNASFDRADMFWLRGYAQLLSAFLEFTLAYDWRQTYDGTAHLFFAGATDPSGARADPNPALGRESPPIADAIALIHLMRWPVAEPARLQKAREHLKAVIALSRVTWKEILAETDDDHEWIPSPSQKQVAFPGMAVTQERLDAWMKALDEFEEVLDGKKLIPHWRYRQGIDFRAFFDQPRPFDLVLWMTGHAALPYLKDGPVTSQESWAQWQRIFGGEFLAYALWFN